MLLKLKKKLIMKPKKHFRISCQPNPSRHSAYNKALLSDKFSAALQFSAKRGVGELDAGAGVADPHVEIIVQPARRMPAQSSTVGIVLATIMQCGTAELGRRLVNNIIESLRGNLSALHDSGAISKKITREFDAVCSPPVRERRQKATSDHRIRVRRRHL